MFFKHEHRIILKDLLTQINRIYYCRNIYIRLWNSSTVNKVYKKYFFNPTVLARLLSCEKKYFLITKYWNHYRIVCLLLAQLVIQEILVCMCDHSLAGHFTFLPNCFSEEWHLADSHSSFEDYLTSSNAWWVPQSQRQSSLRPSGQLSPPGINIIKPFSLCQWQGI